MVESQDKKQTPSEFLRARRPQLFSDSTNKSRNQLKREVFEYFLETLTNRKQEIEFEYFCRLLAEKEICSNLRPQTGPTGGGDSKVDTETYPISENLAQMYYEGRPNPSNERWAFAFSAKKDWRSKVKSDVSNIAGTNRGYSNIFFITSQFVKDKDRAEVEDSLSQKFKTKIVIFDRSWICKIVFENDRVDLAIEALKISEYSNIKERQLGPQDLKREQELIELENQITDTERYLGVEYQLVEDFLQSAIIARGLGRARVEIDGRFERARNYAKKLGITPQILRIEYAKAWTEFWWYEDFLNFNATYDVVEQLIIGSLQASEVQLLTNLWFLLQVSITQNLMDETQAKFAERTRVLKNELTRLFSTKGSPSNELQARSDYLLVELFEQLFQKNENSIEEKLIALEKVLDESDGLVQFPLTTLCEVILELGSSLPDNSKYDDLLEKVISLTEKRISEGESGRLLLERGLQKLYAQNQYDAIRFLGRAQIKLAKDEYRDEMILALTSCSVAYERAGLLWAARSNMISATSHTITDFWRYGRITPAALFVTNRLIWLELQLGRVPQILELVQLQSTIVSLLVLEETEKEKLLSERSQQDLVLGLLLLKTDFFHFKWLDFMPHLLRELGLPSSRVALLYMLGYVDLLAKEAAEANDLPIDFDSLISDWIQQPANEDLPKYPEFLEQSNATFRSNVIGCDIEVNAANNETSINLSECVLATIEALTATSLNEIFPYRSLFTLKIKPSPFIERIIETKIVANDSDSSLEIMHPESIDLLNAESQSEFRSVLLQITANILARIAFIGDAQAYLEHLAKEEAVFDRALAFSAASFFISNFLGRKPRLNLSDWKDPNFLQYPNLRRTPLTIKSSKQSDIDNPPKALNELESYKGFSRDEIKHTQRGVISLINPTLWEKAKWSGTAFFYAYPPHPSTKIPMIGIGFKNISAGQEIFKNWRKVIGASDEKDQLRISIITGIDKDNPAFYRVFVGSNLDPSMFSEKKEIVFISRINEMRPSTLDNLNRFIENFELHKTYLLGLALFRSSDSPPNFIEGYSIQKYALNVIPAYRVGPNDIELTAINPDDNPLIPKEIVDPPIISTLKKVAEIRKKRNQ